MTTAISETAALELADETIAGADSSAPLPATPAAPVSTDVATSLTGGEGAIEAELDEMENAADALRKEGLISSSEADSKKAEVERTRKVFRDLAPEARAEIVRRRRELGVQMLSRQLAGAAVVSVNVKLDHTRLRPLFEQWWPYLNRMSVNLQRFGESTFGKGDLGKVEAYLEAEVSRLEEYVDEQLRVAEAFRERSEADMRARNDIVFQPTVTRPSLEMDVEVYSRFAMRALSVISKFDKTMTQFDFMVWNGLRDQTDVNAEVQRFLRKFQPLGLRSYMTHLKLMTTIRGL
ncbi:ATPase (plasmid) [Cupriavidus sp. USMAHM13]|uniref:ATPase n=1 Tax=Cupriavidus sp. USMAHM13 TaxID=1389192 RepID=UPI0008A6882F|nr:ATPase [Cupriavidus sp. USMAHM13]AOZ04279.1 ATPase [Cupriavidus sp. USMAHM13]